MKTSFVTVSTDKVKKDIAKIFEHILTVRNREKDKCIQILMNERFLWWKIKRTPDEAIEELTKRSWLDEKETCFYDYKYYGRESEDRCKKLLLAILYENSETINLSVEDTAMLAMLSGNYSKEVNLGK